MKRLLATLGILIQIISACEAADQKTDHWQSVTLWSNKVLSARLHFLPEASLADESIMTFEFNNQSGTTLYVTNAFLNLDGDRKDPATGKAMLTGAIISGGLYTGKLAPGITIIKGIPLLIDAIGGVGLPPKRGYSVDITSRCDVRLSDGQVFATSPPGAGFHLEWKYPSPTEIEAAKPRLRALLVNPEYKSEHKSRLEALIVVDEIADSLTPDELLLALKSRQGSVDGRDLVAWVIARRFTTDPKVIAYFRERLSANDRAALSDLGNPQLWNSTWIQPLVTNFEKQGDNDTLRILGMHRGDWATNSQCVSALSAALLKRRPLLNREVSSLGTNELHEWCNNTKEAGIVGDKALIPILTQALDDQRIVEPPLTAMAFPRKDRVCDAALLALLTILDGGPAPAFNQEGVEYWTNDDKTRFAAFDRMIALTKHRLKQLDAPRNHVEDKEKTGQETASH